MADIKRTTGDVLRVFFQRCIRNPAHLYNMAGGIGIDLKSMAEEFVATGQGLEAVTIPALGPISESE